jgi:hypothetical protein
MLVAFDKCLHEHAGCIAKECVKKIVESLKAPLLGLVIPVQLEMEKSFTPLR